MKKYPNSPNKLRSVAKVFQTSNDNAKTIAVTAAAARAARRSIEAQIQPCARDMLTDLGEHIVGERECSPAVRAADQRRRFRAHTIEKMFDLGQQRFAFDDRERPVDNFW